MPSLVFGATRLVTFVLPVAWLTDHPDFRLTHIWWISVFTVAFQAALSWWLLSMEMRRKLS